jgi:hypothetical protein
LGKFGNYIDRAFDHFSAQREWLRARRPFGRSNVHLGLRSVASHLIGIDTTSNVRGLSNKNWTLYVRVNLDQRFDVKSQN